MEQFDLKKFLVENKLTNNSRLLKEAVRLADLFQGDKPNPNAIVVPNMYYKDENELRFNALRPSHIEGEFVQFSQVGNDKKELRQFRIKGNEVEDIISFEDAKKNL